MHHVTASLLALSAQLLTDIQERTTILHPPALRSYGFLFKFDNRGTRWSGFLDSDFSLRSVWVLPDCCARLVVAVDCVCLCESLHSGLLS